MDKSKFKKHQNTSECRHVLTVEQKESDSNRENWSAQLHPAVGGAGDGGVGVEQQSVHQPPVDPPSE